MFSNNKIPSNQLLKFLWLPIVLLCIFTSGIFAQSDDLLVDLNGQDYAKISGQNASSKKLMKIVHLDKGHVLLRDVLQDIADQAGLMLSYSEQLIPLRKKINVKQTNLTAKKALWMVLEGTSLRFGVSPRGQLFFFKMHKMNSSTPLEVVSGTVTEATSGESLPGVNVIVKGTTIGASTDSDGRYELNAPTLQDTLVFSFVGYQTAEIPIQGRTEVNIELQPQAISGEELVVVGYGTQERQQITGAVSSVSSDEFVSGNVNNVSDLIQGKIPGLVISRPGGNPNQDARIRLRGVSTFGANQEPLVVVNGIIGASLENIDPNDIESIDVLKDASASAIYGTRGASGVILVTTKGGSPGRTNVSYNSSFSFVDVANKIDVLAMNIEVFRI